MSASVKCSATYRTEGNQPLVADRGFTDFIVSLPASAALSPIMVDAGSQRDPWPVMVGVRADWTEER